MEFNTKWGINRKTYKQVSKLRNKTYDPPFQTDDPSKCCFGPNHWHFYPVKDYNYRFNSWGYRGEDYQQYEGQPVNICIGDSCTVNIGGPVNHSWPALLSCYFDIPTLNFGMNGLCYYDFRTIVDKARSFFQVKRVFLLYNLFANDQEPVNTNVIPIYNNSKIHTKLGVLKNHCWVHNAYWQFDPPWTFFDEELPYLYEHFPEAHNYLRMIKFDYRSIDLSSLLNQSQLKAAYQKISGNSWMSYEKFCEIAVIDTNVLDYFTNKIDKHLAKEFLSGYFIPTMKKMLLTSRDGWHMSKLVNQNLANYFYEQTMHGQ